MKEAQDFLVKLNRTDDKDKEQQAYAIKSFMRIIFKGIYLKDRKIVRMELNQPWKYCYEEALKMDSSCQLQKEDQKIEKGETCQRQMRKSTKVGIKRVRKPQSYCAPSDAK